MELTTRELASIILLVVFVGVLLTNPKTRRTALATLPGLRIPARAFLVSIIVPCAVYFAYITMVAFVAYQIDLWNFSLLKDTLIIAFFVGFPLFVAASEIETGKALITKVARNTVGISVLLAFYLNIKTLPLWSELFFQLIISVFAFMALVAQSEEKTRKLGELFNVFNALIGIGLFVYTTVQIVQSWNTFELEQLVASLTVSVCFPVLLVPLVYVFAFILRCNKIYSTLAYHNNNKKPTIRARIALLIGLHFSIRLASSFKDSWLKQIAQAVSLRGGINVMTTFRQSLR